MKLVELLARELIEWPEKASHAVQHEDGDVGFTYDGKPGRDKDHSDWSINALTASEKAYWLIGAATNISTTASDHATAIVTRTDWAAERARIAKPAKKADKDGWTRHRGGPLRSKRNEPTHSSTAQQAEQIRNLARMALYR